MNLEKESSLQKGNHGFSMEMPRERKKFIYLDVLKQTEGIDIPPKGLIY